MNAQRRKDLSRIIDAIREQTQELSAVRDEEQDAFDAMPESIQESDRGTKAQEAIDAIDDALSSITDAVDGLESAQL